MGIILFIGVLLLLMLFWRGIEVVTDWYWFQEMGYENVFTVTFLTQMKVAALFGAAFFVIFYLNLFLASRFSSRGYWVDKDDLIHIPPWEAGNQPLGPLIFSVPLFLPFRRPSRLSSLGSLLTVFSGHGSASRPLFNRDIGFYVFQFPFHEAHLAG
jgi:uncharacterized membrane protein (UPF0182 family)